MPRRQNHSHRNRLWRREFGAEMATEPRPRRQKHSHRTTDSKIVPREVGKPKPAKLGLAPGWAGKRPNINDFRSYRHVASKNRSKIRRTPQGNRHDTSETDRNSGTQARPGPKCPLDSLPGSVPESTGSLPGRLPGRLPGILPGRLRGRLPGKLPGPLPGILPGDVPPEGCSLGHCTVLICGFGGSPFWKHPSPYCRVSQIWGRGLGAKWLAR